MPGRDRTGPMGRGPLTGRGFGGCCGVGPRGYGYGYGAGRGLGRRGGYGYFPYYGPAVETPVEEKDFLRLQREELMARLRYLDKQLEDLTEEDE